jgi:hypothetical protein
MGPFRADCRTGPAWYSPWVRRMSGKLSSYRPSGLALTVGETGAHVPGHLQDNSSGLNAKRAACCLLDS